MSNMHSHTPPPKSQRPTSRTEAVVRHHEAVVRHQCVHVQRMAYGHTHMCATARRRVARAGAHPRPGLGDRAGIATKTIRLKSINVSVQSCQNITMGQTRCTTNNAMVTARCREKDGEVPRKRRRRKRQQQKSTSVGRMAEPICAHTNAEVWSSGNYPPERRQMSGADGENQYATTQNVDDPPWQNSDKRVAQLAKANVQPHKSRGFGRL